MKNNIVSLDNYHQILSKDDIKSLPNILQKGHQFFLEARDFYDQEPEIKETIDIYLEQLNLFLSSQKKQNSNDAAVDF